MEDKIAYSELVARFKPVPLEGLVTLTPMIEIDELIREESLEPENLCENIYDPNDFYVEPRNEPKKKTSATEAKQKQVLLIGKSEEKKEVEEERKKNYKPGPFALFYELNEGKLEKDVEAWYYKEHKEIIGPVSSYNMDKLVYYRKVDEDTRVAFKSIDKFVKFGKIKKILEAERKEE